MLFKIRIPKSVLQKSNTSKKILFCLITETDARVGTEKWTTDENGFVKKEKQKPRTFNLTVMFFDSHNHNLRF